MMTTRYLSQCMERGRKDTVLGLSREFCHPAVQSVEQKLCFSFFKKQVILGENWTSNCPEVIYEIKEETPVFYKLVPHPEKNIYIYLTAGKEVGRNTSYCFCLMNTNCLINVIIEQ